MIDDVNSYIDDWNFLIRNNFINDVDRFVTEIEKIAYVVFRLKDKIYIYYRTRNKIKSFNFNRFAIVINLLLFSLMISITNAMWNVFFDDFNKKKFIHSIDFITNSFECQINCSRRKKILLRSFQTNSTSASKNFVLILQKNQNFYWNTKKVSKIKH